MPDENIEKLVYKNYISMIENSIGSNMFRNFYVRFKDAGVEVDIMDNGDKSCAFYVSSILYLFGLIKKPHATVNSAVEDMEGLGWNKIENPNKGDVVVWEEKDGYTHIGFYWDKEEAISNSFEDKHPVKHHLTYNNNRKIIAIYTKSLQA